MMSSISIASHQVGFSPGIPSVWSDFSHGLTRVRNMCKPERPTESIGELADGNLASAFGESQPSGNTRAFHPSKNATKANKFSSSHVEQITSGKNTFQRRTSSNFKTQSLIPVSAEKTGNSIINQRDLDFGYDVVLDNFGSEKANGKTHYVNRSKRVHWSTQRSSSAYGKGSSIQRSSPAYGNGSSIQGSSPAYGKGSYVSVPKNEDGPALNELSVDYEIVDLFKQFLPSIINQNPKNKAKSYNQYNVKTKEGFKEDANKRQSLTEEEKLPARKFYSKIGPQKTKYEKKTKIMDKSLSEAFLLSRPPSNFVRRSPIPLSAIKRDVRPVPGMKESKFSFSKKKSTGQDEGILQDSEEMPTSVENDSFLGDSPCLSKEKLNDLSKLELVDLKIDVGKLTDLDGTPTSSENGSACRVLSSLSADKPCDLSELKHMELKKIAKSYGLKGYSKLKKAEILELLRNEVRQS